MGIGFLAVFLIQWVGAIISFLVSLIVPGLFLGVPDALITAMPESGFLSQYIALSLTAVVTGSVILWAARRSGLSSGRLWFQLFFLTFGIQTFMTQIETGYFIEAFPLLNGNLTLFQLVFQGLLSAGIFSFLIVLITSNLLKSSDFRSKYDLYNEKSIKRCLWLGIVYFILYEIFGYFIAWQSADLRLFYGSSGSVNSFMDQLVLTLMSKPEMPVFQYFRGILWIICLAPTFRGFTGGRKELVLFSALALGLLPSVQLSFPNPLMPANVSFIHFWEILMSNAIFGALCGWLVPKAIRSR